MKHLVTALVLLLPACSATTVRELKNGQLRVQCPAEQSECIREAELHCEKQGGVHIISSREKNELYGVEGNKEGILMSEIIFVCGDDQPRKPIKLPPRSSAVEPKPAATPEKRVCVPGSTQRCVGAGACSGGQSCNPLGTGWSICECATRPPTPKAQEGAEPGGDGGVTHGQGGAGQSASSKPASGTVVVR